MNFLAQKKEVNQQPQVEQHEDPLPQQQVIQQDLNPQVEINQQEMQPQAANQQL